MPITIEEARAMRGVEFTYYVKGDSVKCYIKAFDPEIGLTCVSLGLITKRGIRMRDTEGDGTSCVMGYDFKKRSASLPRALKALSLIDRTGSYRAGVSGTICGYAHCAF